MATPPDADLRVPLASERTLLAWIRTGIALMGFGFIVARLGLFLRETSGTPAPAPRPSSIWIGTAFVGLGVVVQVVASWRHRSFVRRWAAGKPDLPPWSSFGIVCALVLAALGVAMAAYLLSLAA